MRKPQPEPKWLDNLKALIEHRKTNPRALSLRAGLNATAIRDMFEGRAKFPRYDTIEALAKALDVTPAQLMGGTPESVVTDAARPQCKDPLAEDDLNILTEIITRLQEVAAEQKHQLRPNDFAVMVMTIYRQVQANPITKITKSGIEPHIKHLIAYESARRAKTGTKK